MPIDPEKIACIEIYPPIGVARVGDSQEWFVGPHVPGIDPIHEDGKFKDAEHKIRRCAAVFRLYAFDADGTVLGEIDATDSRFDVDWTVHVANKKSAWVKFRGQYREEKFKLRNPTVDEWKLDSAGQPIHDYAHTDTRTKLIIDSGEVHVGGANAASVDLRGEFFGTGSEAIPVHLGEIHTDGTGRLVVLPSNGHAWSIETDGTKPEEQPFQMGPFDNNDWVDTMFDGHVTVKVSPKGSPNPYLTKHRATVIAAPPHFANGHHCPTTLYELIEDVYERKKRKDQGTSYDVGEVDYYKHIDPMFRRMYMNSWTNFRANEGHGPRKASLFLDNPDLSNKDTEFPLIRKHIFDRLREPVVKTSCDTYPTAEAPIPVRDPTNLALRTEQAYMYYMPRLGGNNSDMPEKAGDDNDADRWSSLTQLQFDRFKKWSEGNFKTGERPTQYRSLKDIPLQEQPAALTFAALEWSVGAPLYPGIECYWLAEFTEMYDLTTPFRFSDKVLPGHLSRGLALPWHADFNMCNTHWWPSVRPDNIVTEEYFNKVQQNFQLQGDLKNLSINLNDRERWDDGLDRHPEWVAAEGDERNGNSDLVRKWTKLGFISTVSYGAGADAVPISIELERCPGFSRTPVPSADPFPPPPDPDA